MLWFSIRVKTIIKSSVVADDAETPSKTLAESAAAHQAKLARPELQEVQVKTGEEDESNVFQVKISCNIKNPTIKYQRIKYSLLLDSLITKLASA